MVHAFLSPLAGERGVESPVSYARTDEVSHGRVERLTCYTTEDRKGIRRKAEWDQLSMVGGIESGPEVGWKLKSVTR